jgi:hypothetical protein
MQLQMWAILQKTGEREEAAARLGFAIACGILHADKAGRDSLVHDLMEPLRLKRYHLFIEFTCQCRAIPVTGGRCPGWHRAPARGSPRTGPGSATHCCHAPSRGPARATAPPPPSATLADRPARWPRAAQDVPGQRDRAAPEGAPHRRMRCSCAIWRGRHLSPALGKD